MDKSVICGTDILTVSLIESVEIRSVTEDDLLDIERVINGDDVSLSDLFPSSLLSRIKVVLSDFARDICTRLPKPLLTDIDLLKYASDYNYLEKPENWKIAGGHQLTVTSSFDNDGDVAVQWDFDIERLSSSGSLLGKARTQRTIMLSEIMPVLQELTELPKPKNAWSSFWSNYPYKDIQDKLRPVYNDYYKRKEIIDQRINKRRSFFSTNCNKKILCIRMCDGSIKKYMEDFCNFDVVDKESELLAVLEKNKNSHNVGEQKVEYALKWVVAANDGRIAIIKGDCESKYRYNCIMLNNTDFIDDPQEYDHIVVCSAGVVIIETKHWVGSVEIRPDGKWIRKSDEEKAAYGIESPKFQMRRHEAMLQSILPDTPIHSLLCFSNPSTIIDGRENFSDYPIIAIDQLEEVLADLCAAETYSSDEINCLVAKINAHKVNVEK